MKNQSITTEEVEAVKKEATVAVELANALTIENEEQMTRATEIMSQINGICKSLKERKEKITKPLNEALKSARELFKPIELAQSEAVGTIKKKMLTYHTKVEAERVAKQEKIEKRVDKGTMRMDTGMKKLDDIGIEQKAVKTEAGSAQFRTIKKVYIKDENLIPRKYLMLNMALISRDAKAGIEIKGVEVKSEKTIANVL